MDNFSLTVLSVFTNQKFPANFLWSKWLRKMIPSILIKVVLGFRVKPSVATLCFISPKKNDPRYIVHNTQIYRPLSTYCKRKMNTVKDIQWTFKKKVVNCTLKLCLVFTPILSKLCLAFPSPQLLFSNFLYINFQETRLSIKSEYENQKLFVLL